MRKIRAKANIVDVTDVSGQSRPREDVEAALAYLKQQIVTDPMSMTKQGVPRLMHYVVMLDVLRELLELRARAR